MELLAKLCLAVIILGVISMASMVVVGFWKLLGVDDRHNATGTG